jgi:hypothetical protein
MHRSIGIDNMQMAQKGTVIAAVAIFCWDFYVNLENTTALTLAKIAACITN